MPINREKNKIASAFCTDACVILAFLIILFWQLFFSPYTGLARKVQAFLSFTFKLVCLAFLAITLKRLRNDPHLPVALAVLFMGLGPLLSAIVAKTRIKSTQG